jgi:hypothetical protein
MLAGVFGLGDSGYVFYNSVAKELDAQLVTLRILHPPSCGR